MADDEFGHDNAVDTDAAEEIGALMFKAIPYLRGAAQLLGEIEDGEEGEPPPLMAACEEDADLVSAGVFLVSQIAAAGGMDAAGLRAWADEIEARAK